MNVKSFSIEESKVNKGMMILVATTEDGNKYVVGGDHYNPTAIIPYQKAWDAIGQEAFKQLTNPAKMETGAA